MDLEIHLQPEWRAHLLNHVPRKSGVRAALENAVELLGGVEAPDEFVVTCAEAEVPILRRTAETHCPRAVRFIDFAVERSRLYRWGRS
ncbi:MAG TPA: hypothetical protein VGA73_18255 [Candidatus Binatia bacterium]